jgi:hypothetical protein
VAMGKNIITRQEAQHLALEQNLKLIYRAEPSNGENTAVVDLIKLLFPKFYFRCDILFKKDGPDDYLTQRSPQVRRRVPSKINRGWIN